MWLLNTSSAELKFFPSPESVPSPGFAILSHVWDDIEESFQDIQALRTRCAVTQENPRDLACEKIRKSCELAERHGYQWLWVDTCCIDKTSSTELSEAINSMFRYYSIAALCYAYLRDVSFTGEEDINVLVRFPPSHDGPRNALVHTPSLPRHPEPDYSSLARAFTSSKWYSRGWTLQELIAPAVVLFVSQSWDVLGSKSDFAELIQDITGIPTALLRCSAQLSDFSIARRMSWAAKRCTTRREDEAYCLLGIFNINMPTLYGEGHKAFRRLQEEIMKHDPDTTLFAWGSRMSDRHLRGYGLLASSPSDFENSHRMRFTPNLRSSAKRREGGWSVRRLLRRCRDTGRDSGIMSFSVTPYGIIAQFPILKTKDPLRVLGDLGWSISNPNGGPQGRVFLVLHLVRGQFSSNSTYFVDHMQIPSSSNTHIDVQGVWKWKTVYIVDLRAGGLKDPSATIEPHRCLANNSFHSPFRFPMEDRRKVLVTVLCEDTKDPNRSNRQPKATVLSLKIPQLPWNGVPAATFRIDVQFAFDDFVTHRGRPADAPGPSYCLDWAEGTLKLTAAFTLSFGCCTAGSGLSAVARRFGDEGMHWANVCQGSFLDESRATPGHDCSRDHVWEWPHLIRTFSILYPPHHPMLSLEFTLVFTPYLPNPARVLELKSVTLRLSRITTSRVNKLETMFLEPVVAVPGGYTPSLDADTLDTDVLSSLFGLRV